MSTSILSANPVMVSLSDLSARRCDHVLPEAFGPDSLGIIIVNGLDPRYQALRERVLRSALALSKLPPTTLAGLESEESKWIVGWSCGKERLANDQPDVLKGSYYVNCAFRQDPSLEGPTPELIEGLGDYSPYTTPNLWPAEVDMPQFQADLKALCNMIIDVAQVVAAACDRYCGEHLDEYPAEGYMAGIVDGSYTTKARLLHYFPATSSSPTPWCGEHLDHSCLTGLTSAMFIDASGQTLAQCPDPDAGLYIRSRSGEAVKVSIPGDCLAFQTGQALQEITNGKFKAVPHYVQGCSTPGVSRETLAVFCQPNLKDVVNLTTGETFASFADRILNANH